jgi:hypothetical protein
MNNNPNWGRPQRRWEIWHETDLLSLTGTTAQTALCPPVLLPGNLLGGKGSIRITPMYGATNDADDKVLRIKFGGVTMFQPSSSTFDNLAALRPPAIWIKNTAFNAQIAPAITMNGATSTNALGIYAVDTSVDQYLEFTGQLQDAADTLQILLQVEIARG